MMNKMVAYEKQKVEIKEQIEEIERQIEVTRIHNTAIKENIEETITERQMNFELLLQFQKKLNTYTDIVKGRKPYMVYRTNSALTSAYTKELNINSKLTKIVENLLGDFPNHIHELTRISNTLKLPVYIYFQ